LLTLKSVFVHSALCNSEVNNFRSIYLFFSAKQRTVFVLLILCMGVNGLVEALTVASVPSFVFYLFSAGNKSNFQMPSLIYESISALPFSNRVAISLFFLFMLLLSILLRLSIASLNLSFAAKVGHSVSVEVFRQAIMQPYIVQLKTDTSSILALITSHVNQVVSSIFAYMQCLSSVIVSISIILVLFKASPDMTILIALSLMLLYFLLGSYSKRRLTKNSIESVKYTHSQIRSIKETLASVKLVILSSSQSYFVKLFKESDFQLRRVVASNAFIGIYPRYIAEFLAVLLLVSISLNSIRIGNNHSVATIITLTVAAQRLLPSLQQFFSNWSMIRSMSNGVGKVYSFLSSKKDFNPIIIHDVNTKYLGRPEIVINDITFSYGESKEPVLSNLSLTIANDQSIAIIGETGSGKSTLLDIILSLLLPQQGSIDIDGINIVNSGSIVDSQERYKYMNSISAVTQSFYLCDATFYENIAFGIPFSEIDRERVIISARLANIHNFIMSTPNNYMTYIGEDGISMSGGQRQRIAIARALYEQKSILVLDEATSALDPETEKLILENIHSSGWLTNIIHVTHRRSLLCYYDRIIEVTKGAITFDGSFTDFDKS